MPWLGFWNKILSSDVFILSTGIQFVRRSYGNRAVMKDNNSWATIPVFFNFENYNKILISDMGAVKQIGRRVLHWSQQKQYKYSNRLDEIIDRLINNDENNLCQLNIDLIFLILKAINHKSTKLVIEDYSWGNEDKTKIITSMVMKYGNVYLSGSSGIKYMSRDDIKEVDKAYIQRVLPDIGGETILHSIAYEEKPIDYINKNATWEIW